MSKNRLSPARRSAFSEVGRTLRSQLANNANAVDAAPHVDLDRAAARLRVASRRYAQPEPTKPAPHR